MRVLYRLASEAKDGDREKRKGPRAAGHRAFWPWLYLPKPKDEKPGDQGATKGVKQEVEHACPRCDGLLRRSVRWNEAWYCTKCRAKCQIAGAF
jgi:hypothetical protein